MFVFLSRDVGSLIISDTAVVCPYCIELDGSTIRRQDYPELFRVRVIETDALKLPDARGRIQGASVWIIAKSLPAGCCLSSCARCRGAGDPRQSHL